jgi:predicted nucleotidyltransferase
MPDIQVHKAKLHALCRTYGVERLALFGSATSEAFDACQAIQDFTSEVEFSEYERNLMLRSAVERQLEIVG